MRPKSKRSLVSGPVLTVAVVDDPHGTHRIQVGPQAVRTCAGFHLSLAKEVQDSETRGSRDRVVASRLSRRRSNHPLMTGPRHDKKHFPTTVPYLGKK